MSLSSLPYRLLTLGIVLCISTSVINGTVLFDFTTCDPSEADSWTEISDTVRKPGMSKAVFALQRTRVFQRGVMFAMINPQPNGAGFAGVQRTLPDDIGSRDSYTGITFKARAQGQLKYWKVVLVDSDQVANRTRYDYEQKFPLDLSTRKFEVVTLPFSDFKAYRRGKLVPDAPALNFSDTGAFGLQTFGGVYDGYKQQGSGSLEIDSVSLY